MGINHDTAEARSDAVLGYLQELLLSATLLGERLPGSRKPVRLSTCGGVLLQPPTKILRSNLAASLKLDDLPRHLQAVSPEQLAQPDMQGLDEEIHFFTFRPAGWMSDRVELSLVIGSVRQENGERRCREIGSVDAVFRQVEGRWSVLGEPHVFIAPAG